MRPYRKNRRTAKFGRIKDNFDEAEITKHKNIIIFRKFLRAKAGSGIRVALPAFTDGK